VQHVSGIGQPKDVVSINLDPSAPMMLMADLALVTDAAALTDALAGRLGVTAPRREGTDA
jgi:electron transfer flavoprotein alpha subunit